MANSIKTLTLIPPSYLENFEKLRYFENFV